MQKDTRTALIFTGAIVGLLVLSMMFRSKPAEIAANDETVTMENGTQVIHISARGGYFPSRVTAQAGIPTNIQVATNGTYDCSASLLIPALKYQSILQPTGTETIPLTAAQATGTLKGTCSMGMYRFEIAFQ